VESAGSPCLAVKQESAVGLGQLGNCSRLSPFLPHAPVHSSPHISSTLFVSEGADIKVPTPVWTTTFSLCVQQKPRVAFQFIFLVLPSTHPQAAGTGPVLKKEDGGCRSSLGPVPGGPAVQQFAWHICSLVAVAVSPP
jgi:hypothetical protein